MDSQQLCCLFFRLTWIFVFLVPSVCSGMDAPKMSLESTVFVAFAGENLNIPCDLAIPVNQTSDILKCFDPLNKEIYRCDISGTPGSIKLSLELKNLTHSGKYYCQYKTAKGSLFLRVRAEGYNKPIMWDYTEFIVVAVFSGVLLLFSVFGSVHVFRGYCKKTITESGRKQKQNKEEMKEKEMEENGVDVMTAQSTSFYASLEHRPRSIYDVLDHSSANTEPNQKKAKNKKKAPQKTVEQTTELQGEGVFECVYENF
ncbi:NFAT activation molecule 1 [Embiotoca jacksoni]|uniref:NFAT activation molecule 1 n=1 Tax=Embiotoca jacksoni TaxID=100190 RepID=UPI003704C5DD